MYLEHFGLSEPPFRITPHTDFFFAGANRGATLEALIYAITHDEGIVKVSGEVGSGKTMLCRVLMERLPAHVTIVYLANPSLSRDDILFAIGDELQLPQDPQARPSLLLRGLQEHLITLYAEGRQVVVLVDEAHAMPTETLEEIRLLSNLESNRHKLLQLVLFGQPELNDVLARSDMRQLKERITHNFVLEPLVREDIAQYLDFRMRAAGYRGPELFTAAAVRLIASSSLGLTRRINILADKALLAAFSENAHQITPKYVRAAVRDSQFSTVGRPPRMPAALAAGLLGLAALALAALLWPRGEAGPAANAQLTPTASAPAASAPAVSVPPDAATTPAATAPANPASPPASTATPPASPVAAPALARADLGKTAVVPKPAASSGPALGKLTQARIAETREWLASAPDHHWFIQLLAANATEADHVEHFIGRAEGQLGGAPVRAYTAPLGGTARIGVIYGAYPNREAALAAIAALPTELRAYKPYPRMVKRLR